MQRYTFICKLKVDLGFRQITLKFFVKGKFFLFYTAFSSTFLYCIFISKEKNSLQAADDRNLSYSTV